MTLVSSQDDLSPAWTNFLEDPVSEAISRTRHFVQYLPCSLIASLDCGTVLHKGKRCCVASFKLVLPTSPGAVYEIAMAAKSSSSGFFTIITQGESMDNQIRATVLVGDLHISMEDFNDLSPGIELQFTAPSEWKVVIQVGQFPVALGRFQLGKDTNSVIIDELFDSPSINRKHLSKFSE